jgi:hypothetical protein
MVIHGMVLGALFLLAFAGGLAGMWRLKSRHLTTEVVAERTPRLLVHAGNLPRWLAVVHALGAIGFAATLIGTLIDYETAIMNAGLIALSTPYFFS